MHSLRDNSTNEDRWKMSSRIPPTIKGKFLRDNICNEDKRKLALRMSPSMRLEFLTDNSTSDDRGHHGFNAFNEEKQSLSQITPEFEM